MSTEPKIPSELDNLSPELAKKLQRIQSEISFEKLTVSFSIEERDPSGRKMSSFYSVTAGRGAGAEIPLMGCVTAPAGFNASEVKISRALLCKHVVAATYDDVIRRRMVPMAKAQEECRAVMQSYDKLIVHLLTTQNGTGTGEPK